MVQADLGGSGSLISASRRTDVPRHYARWFAERRRQGFAEFRTAYGTPGRASLLPKDVIGYLFWTRDAGPFMQQLRALKQEATPFAFQFTITGYGRDLEPRRPERAAAIASFQAVSALLPGPESIQWRYDPILLSEQYPAAHHIQQFEQIARRLSGTTRVVNVSFVEPYAKAVRRIQDPSVEYRAVDPKRHKSVARNHPNLPTVHGTQSLLEALASVASACGMQLRVCCNPEYSSRAQGYPGPSQCIGPELYAPYGAALLAQLASLPSAPSRSACRCLRAVDIGMDETCPSGCAYCYVTRSEELALSNWQSHDPRSPSLRR